MKVARNWVDPFDEMLDEEFDAHVDALFSARPGSVAVSLRAARIYWAAGSARLRALASRIRHS